jgi:HEAT repeat protein
VDDPSAIVLLETLAASLGDPVPRVAMAAADAFAAIAARSGSCDALLRRSLHSASPSARWAAAFAAAQLAPPTPRLLPPLVEALACNDGAVRWRAVRLLVDGASVLPEVERMLTHLATASDAQPRIRQMAVHALRLLAPAEEETERTCLIAARDPDPRVRCAAAAALATSSGAAAGLQLLEMAARDADDGSARLALCALASLGVRDPTLLPPPTFSVLRSIAGGNGPKARRAAAKGALERLEGGGPSPAQH